MRKLTPGSGVLAALIISFVLSGCGAGNVGQVRDVQSKSDAVAEAATAAFAARTAAEERAAAEAAAADAAIDAAKAAAAAPALTITCSDAFQGDARWVDSGFGYDIKAYPPFRVRIDYGDGRSYEGDDRHLAAVFSHRYTAPGEYTVVASVTDAEGGTADGTCINSWIPTSYVPVTPASPAMPAYPGAGSPAGVPGGGYPVTCSDGWTSNSGGKSGACSSHGGIG